MLQRFIPSLGLDNRAQLLATNLTNLSNFSFTISKKRVSKNLRDFIIISVTALSTNLAGQSSFTADLPQLLPSSPEPTAFVKAGVGNSNLSTGAATASIPLYTIKVKDFTFPISVSYSTQGLKADEASSRVGYGWVLNATGMITRSVKGEPDEFAQRLSPPTDFNTYSDNLYYY